MAENNLADTQDVTSEFHLTKTQTKCVRKLASLAKKHGTDAFHQDFDLGVSTSVCAGLAKQTGLIERALKYQNYRLTSIGIAYAQKRGWLSDDAAIHERMHWTHVMNQRHIDAAHDAEFPTAAQEIIASMHNDLLAREDDINRLEDELQRTYKTLSYVEGLLEEEKRK